MSLRALFSVAAPHLASGAMAQTSIRRQFRNGACVVLALMVAACGDNEREAQQVTLQAVANEAAKGKCFERGLNYYGDVKRYTRVDGRLVIEVIKERCALTPGAF